MELSGPGGDPWLPFKLIESILVSRRSIELSRWLGAELVSCVGSIELEDCEGDSLAGCERSRRGEAEKLLNGEGSSPSLVGVEEVEDGPVMSDTDACEEEVEDVVLLKES